MKPGIIENKHFIFDSIWEGGQRFGKVIVVGGLKFFDWRFLDLGPGVTGQNHPQAKITPGGEIGRDFPR